MGSRQCFVSFSKALLYHILVYIMYGLIDTYHYHFGVLEWDGSHGFAFLHLLFSFWVD